jgi:hypothetical protein
VPSSLAPGARSLVLLARAAKAETGDELEMRSTGGSGSGRGDPAYVDSGFGGIESRPEGGWGGAWLNLVKTRHRTHTPWDPQVPLLVHTKYVHMLVHTKYVSTTRRSSKK